MQIESLKVTDNKCLLDFSIKFNTKKGGCSCILIGENGAGKSTLLDTILEILMSFDSEAVQKRINYQYELKYILGEEKIAIIYDGESCSITKNGAELFTGKMKTLLRKSELRIFPERINYLYSGLNCKELEALKTINTTYKSRIREEIASYWRATVWAGNDYEPRMPKKKYNNVNEEDIPVYLISILCGEDSYEKKYLLEQCAIDQIASVSVKLTTKLLPLFIQEEILNSELDGLYTILDFLDSGYAELLKKGFLYQNGTDFYFELNHLACNGKTKLETYEFFEKIQTILGASFDVFLFIKYSRVNLKDLSEGQRQLIKLFGMLGVSRTENSLSLMDEPDAFMNPKWKYDIKRIIDSLLEGSINSQALIATHDPLLINGVDKKDIRILKVNEAILNNNGIISTEVVEPDENTYGMGVDGLLQSEYYGLRSTLDAYTLELLEKKRNLLVKKKNGVLSDDEKQEMESLTNTLQAMRFANNIPSDDLYDDFVVAMHAIHAEKNLNQLSNDEIEERNGILRKIIDRLGQ